MMDNTDNQGAVEAGVTDVGSNGGAMGAVGDDFAATGGSYASDGAISSDFAAVDVSPAALTAALGTAALAFSGAVSALQGNPAGFGLMGVAAVTAVSNPTVEAGFASMAAAFRDGYSAATPGTGYGAYIESATHTTTTSGNPDFGGGGLDPTYQPPIMFGGLEGGS
jgi:hypothetical protein